MRAFRFLVIATMVVGVACTAKTTVAPSVTLPAPPTVTVTPAPVSSTATTTAAPTPSTTGPAGGEVPAGFSPISVTFVSLQTGWVLGAGCATCTVSILRTRDGGKTWASIPAPPMANATTQVLGSEEIRFANANDGWVVGADLWVTHDGGSHWAAAVLPVPGPAQVADLEASAGVVRAVVLDTGDPVQFRILTSPASVEAWRASPTTLTVGAGPVPNASMVLQGTAGWVVDNDRTVVATAKLANGIWSVWGSPCTGSELLSASSPNYLVVGCQEGLWTNPPPAVRLYTSVGGGPFTEMLRTVPTASIQTVATAAPGTVVIGTQSSDRAAELMATFDGAKTWSTVFRGPANEYWGQLGFTSPTQGIAIETESGASSATLLMTHDGGRTWAPVPFTRASP